MPDDTQEGQKDDNVQAEGKQAEGVPTSEKPAENVDEKTALENSKNPERTKEYIEKLKEENRQLKEQANPTPKKSVLDIFPDDSQTQQSGQNQQPGSQAPAGDTYQNLSQSQVNDIYQGLIDKDGYIDPKALEQRLNAANSAEKQAKEALNRARQAEQRIEKYEQTRQAEQLHETYPELDPYSDSFNQEAYDLVKNEVLNQWASTGKQNAVEAAKKMEKYFRDDKKAQKQIVQQAGGTSGSNRSAPPTQPQKGVIRNKTQFASRLSAYEQSLNN